VVMAGAVQQGPKYETWPRPVPPSRPTLMQQGANVTNVPQGRQGQLP